MAKKIGDFWINFEPGIGYYVAFYYYGDPIQVSKVFDKKQDAIAFCEFLQ